MTLLILELEEPGHREINVRRPPHLHLHDLPVANIAELAGVVRDVVGYTGALRFETSKPDGMPLKGLDSSRLRAMGWQPAVPLRVGLDRTYRWYERHIGPEDQRTR